MLGTPKVATQRLSCGLALLVSSIAACKAKNLDFNLRPGTETTGSGPTASSTGPIVSHQGEETGNAAGDGEAEDSDDFSVNSCATACTSMSAEAESNTSEGSTEASAETDAESNSGPDTETQTTDTELGSDNENESQTESTDTTTGTENSSTGDSSTEDSSTEDSSTETSESTETSTTETDTDTTTETGDVELGPWSAPTRIAELASSATEDDPTLPANQLELFFNSNRGSGDENIWVATRERIDDPWGDAIPVDELNSSYRETTPSITPDGLTMTFASARGHSGNLEIYISRRATLNAQWSTPEAVDALNHGEDNNSATLTPDGLAVYVCLRRSGVSHKDIYYARRDTLDAEWSQPSWVPDLSSDWDDCMPFRAERRSEIYFSSSRHGTQGYGDIWQAEVVEEGWNFINFTSIAAINSSADDGDPWVSPSGRTMYFASNRAGSLDLYISTRE